MPLKMQIYHFSYIRHIEWNRKKKELEQKNYLLIHKKLILATMCSTSRHLYALQAGVCLWACEYRVRASLNHDKDFLDLLHLRSIEVYTRTLHGQSRVGVKGVYYWSQWIGKAEAREHIYGFLSEIDLSQQLARWLIWLWPGSAGE